MWERELQVAVDAARRAGEIVREVYERPFEVVEKSHDNPLTEADLRANESIHAAITAAFPGDGWLSEETRDSHERLSRRRVWIVDPLDGTKEFVKRNGEFTVNIALIDRHEAVLGVVHAPVLAVSYLAARGVGAFVVRDGEPHAMHTRATPPRPARRARRSSGTPSRRAASKSARDRSSTTCRSAWTMNSANR